MRHNRDARNAPLIRIARTYRTLGLAQIEALACGHIQWQRQDIYARPTDCQSRRCVECRDGVPPHGVFVGRDNPILAITDPTWSKLFTSAVADKPRTYCKPA